MIHNMNKNIFKLFLNYLLRKFVTQKQIYDRQRLEFPGNYSLIKHMIRYSVGFALIIIFYAVSPLIVVRIGSIRTKTIGDFCCTMDYGAYFGSLSKKRYFDLRYFYTKYDGAIANSFLYDLVKKKYIFFPRFYLEPALFYAKRFRKFKKHVLPYYCGREVLIKPLGEWPSPQEWSNIFSTKGLQEILSFEVDEIKQLKSQLGVTKDNLIGVHVRDSNYDSTIISNLSKLKNWQHRIEPLKVFAKQSEFRNSNILNYIPAISELDALNNNLIRFGNNSQVFSQKNIEPLIDYANSNFYSAKNDLILLSELEYLICSASGLAHLAHWMRVPIFLIDFSDLFHIPARGITISSAPIILPKEIRYKKNDEPLTIEEIKNFQEFRLRTPKWREYLQSAESKIYLLENNSETIKRTILLGNSYVQGSDISSEVELGKEAYQYLYNFDSYSLAPILSPYWANLNATKR